MNLSSGCAGRAAAIIIFLTILLSPASVLSSDLCVQLKWYHQSQFAGLYMAQEEGYYSSRGINVKFLEGGPGIDWQKRIKDADCPVGITNAYEVVIAKAAKVPVKAIAAIAQVSPIVFFSLDDSGLTDPRQFKGKKIALVPTGKIHLRGMLKKVGLSIKDIELRPFSLDMTPLYKREVDVWSGYVTNLVTKAEQEGHNVNVIHPINYGVQIYDDVIYAREDLIGKSPEIVEKFLRATLEGWRKAITEPELAVQHTLNYTKKNNKKHEMGLLLRTIPYIHTGEVPIGWMEKSVWDEICVLTRDVGLIDFCVMSEKLYTDRFLREIYEGQP